MFTKGREGLDDVLKEYKSGHKIVVAHPRHIPYLAQNIRKEDLLEVACMSGNPEKAFEQALENDIATLTVLDPQDIPYAMFGVGKCNEETYIWMLGTNDVTKYKFEFLKRCRDWVWAFVDEYEKVFNFVHVDNTLAIKWLAWCKATFSDEFEINGQKFMKFTIIKEDILDV